MQLTTACPLDCPDTCTLSATVESGRLVKVGAGPGNPITDGFICKKVKGYAGRVYAPERVLTPLRRTGAKGAGEFEPIGWDDALDLIAAQVTAAAQAHGPETIVPYLYNSSGSSLGDVLPTRLWRRFGASQIIHSICALTAGIAYHATFDRMLSADPRDVVHAKTIVVWGANPAATNTHLLPLIARAQREGGAKVIVVDPRRTGMAKRADLHLAPYPGTDTVLALAMAHELARSDRLDRAFLSAHVDGVDEFLAAAQQWPLERAAQECGVPAGAIHDALDLIAADGPVLFRVGWGLERHRSGGSAVAAVLALPVLVGQFGVAGSGVMASLSEASPLATPWQEADRARPGGRRLNMNTFGAALCDPELDPPITVLFVSGSNLAVTNPRQTEVLRGLARDDLFTVVHDHVLTDTARFADIVLPAPTHFEVTDVAASYGSYTLQPVVPVIDRVGESRTDNEVAAALAVRLGESASDFDPEPAALIAAADTSGEPLTALRELRAPGTTVQMRDTFPANGRIRLAALPGMGVPRYLPLEDPYPLVLLTPATSKTINSMLAEVDPPSPAVRLHPDDARVRGIADGDAVVVRNDQAAVPTVAKIDPDTRPGVAWMPKGLWCRHLEGGLTPNALVPDTLSDLGGGACFNDTRVEVTRA